jgi:hypothetical protein
MNIKSFFSIAFLLASAWTLSAETLPPIACNMKGLTAEQRKQLDKLSDHVVSAITTSRDLPGGYAVRVDPTRASLMDVAQLLDVWRRCCPFYEFQIDFHAADGNIWLSVKGRPGVKEYIPIDAPRLAAKLPK